MNAPKVLRSLALAGLVALAACHDAPVDVPEQGPGPGELAVVLDTPFDDDGAVWIRVRGPDLSGELTVSEGSSVVTGVGADALDVVIAGDALAGSVAWLAVPDMRAAALYTAEVVEVADEANALRDDLSAYAVRLEALPE